MEQRFLVTVKDAIELLKRVREITASPAPSGGEAVRTGRNIMRIAALAFEAGRDGFWFDLWLVVVMRKRPEYPAGPMVRIRFPPAASHTNPNKAADLLI